MTTNPHNPFDSDQDFEEWLKYELRPRRLLLIDDDKPMHELVGIALKNYRCELHSAHSGASGVDMCLDIRPDVVWLDFKLGDMDGVQVFSEIRERERKTMKIEDLTPVIFVSGYLSQEMIQRVGRVGVALMLQKPDDLNSQKLREVFAHFHIPRKAGAR